MTISTQKLSGFTDQPQQTAATILKRRTTFHNKVGEAQQINDVERVMDFKQIPAHISAVQW